MHSKPEIGSSDISIAAHVEKETLGDVKTSEEPIRYHYLTFETELPAPTRHSFIDDSVTPEAPDLRPYESPFTWSESRKRTLVWLSCIATASTAYAAGSFGAASQQLVQEWDISQTASYVGITMFTTGFAIAPMILVKIEFKRDRKAKLIRNKAPFSELQGRKPVFIATGILFVICQLCCAVTRSFAGMLVARFFVGVGGSTFSTMVGGVVSDIYQTRDRNTPMALFSGFAFFGTGLGPLVSGLIAQHLNWRWIFWVQVITCGLIMLAIVIFFKETRGSVLLSRKAARLNEWYEAREKMGLVGFDVPVGHDYSKMESQRLRWKVKSDEERDTLAKMIGISLYRPFREFPFHFSSLETVPVARDNSDFLSMVLQIIN